MTDSQRSTARELGELLDLAERIQASYEASNRRKVLFRLFQLTMGFAAAGCLVWALSGAEVPALWLVASGVFACYIVGIDATLVQRMQRRSLRDLRALRQVLDLVRELEGEAAVDGNWSSLQRAEFRIRLSRFEIEEPRSPLMVSLRRLR